MSSYSAFVRLLRFSGTSYIGNQKKSQTNPARPARMKVQRHPKLIAMAGIMAGAMIAPMFVPALKMEVAKARSRFGNQRAVALIAEGKFPPSLTPRATRAVKKPLTDPTSAWPIAARLHSTIEVA